MHRAGSGRVAYPTCAARSSFARARAGRQTAHSPPRRPVMGKIADMWNKVTGEVPAPPPPAKPRHARRTVVPLDDLHVGRVRTRRDDDDQRRRHRELRHLARRQGARGERGPLRHRVAPTLARDPADEPRGPRGARSALRPEGVPVRGRGRRRRTGRRPTGERHHDPDDRGVPVRDGGELSRRRAGPGARVQGSAAQRRAARARQAARDVRAAAGRTGDDADDRAGRVAARRSSCTSATAARITCAARSSGG